MLGKKEKLYTKIKNSPHSTSFDDMKRLFELYDFIVENKSGGSHYSVRHPKIKLPIKPLPRRNPIKAPYVKDFLCWIDEIKEG